LDRAAADSAVLSKDTARLCEGTSKQCIIAVPQPNRNLGATRRKDQFTVTHVGIRVTAQPGHPNGCTTGTDFLEFNCFFTTEVGAALEDNDRGVGQFYNV